MRRSNEYGSSDSKIRILKETLQLQARETALLVMIIMMIMLQEINNTYIRKEHV